MSPSLLLHPPGQLSPAAAYYISRQAPAVLQGSPSTVSSSPLSALFSEKESPELWLKYENMLLSCLRTENDQAAHLFLERLVTRFGDDNERIMAFKGLLKEAVARQNGDQVRILNEYDQILSENDTNIPITKRRISLLRSMGRVSDAASSLVQLLEFSPTDAEAWSELSDIYLSQGLYAQAIYAVEEVLVLAPNAWNIHARLGEMQYMAANATGASSGSYQKYMAEALKRFARSIELCDDYLRGYYGLKLVTNKLLQDSNKSNKQVDDDEFALPDVGTIERLNELSTAKLSEIVRHSTAQDRGWRGYDPVEVAAARELLSSDAAAIER
ncbi:TPR repeat protein oca3 [Rhypophila decipiens]|uniref:ER membrane protein complex subunit 2 n=1 Tax=Rhypophila decipiens TaxID=261697 RepID=A0AAN6Y8Z7_9PEZI|nr:TPR repeat protein oca3 [Rhypophila decipiens]